jgi:hypothetical protein
LVSRLICIKKPLASKAEVYAKVNYINLL